MKLEMDNQIKVYSLLNEFNRFYGIYSSQDKAIEKAKELIGEECKCKNHIDNYGEEVGLPLCIVKSTVFLSEKPAFKIYEHMVK